MGMVAYGRGVTMEWIASGWANACLWARARWCPSNAGGGQPIQARFWLEWGMVARHITFDGTEL